MAGGVDSIRAAEGIGLGMAKHGRLNGKSAVGAGSGRKQSH
jgi:hypothetical protein